MAAFGGAALAMAAGLGAETINMAGAMRAEDAALAPQLAVALFEISYVLGYNAAGVGIGILILAVAVTGLRSRSFLPRWIALSLLVIGLAFLTPLSTFLLAPALPLLAGASVQLLRTGDEPDLAGSR